MMRDNLEYYQKHENVTDDMFVNLEPISFIDDYDHGIQAYNHEDYKEAVAFFEKALSKYYQVENECRAHCEMEFDPGSEYKDEATNFHRQITDHYRSVLECYMKCPNEAARVNNESYVRNFVPKIYHYLQFAYYNLDQHKNAARTAKSYLLFYPNNQLISNNLKYFKNAEDTRPIANASKFSRRLKAQSQILRHIYQSFGVHDVDENLLNPFMEDEDENTEGNLDSNDVKIDDTAEPAAVTADDSATLEETKAATNIDVVINDSANKENNLTEAEGDKAEVNKPKK
uniref:Leprecan-like alpha-helical domain-containing protein n=1 Tax=Ciona savignyi TaxID=51511 RepID=H2ZBL7_CIOSA